MNNAIKTVIVIGCLFAFSGTSYAKKKRKPATPKTYSGAKRECQAVNPRLIGKALKKCINKKLSDGDTQ